MTLGRILVVEDDPDQLAALKIMVSALFPDAQVLAVADGFNALAVGPQFRPDAIISDVAMPQADGLSFLHALLPQLPNSPHVLVLTSYDRMQLQRFGPMPEHAQFMQKPITYETLAEALARWQ